MDNVINNPQRPLVAVFGGAKIADKLEAINALIGRAEQVLIGGAMAYTFLRACEILEKAGDKLLLPTDHVMGMEKETRTGREIIGNWMRMDIGPDGDFDGKVAAIEKLDRAIPRMMELQLDVIVVTGDHSTPSAMACHSWHPVPVLIRANTCRVDSVEVFDETACAGGGLGHLPVKHLITLALAHAGHYKNTGPEGQHRTRPVFRGSFQWVRKAEREGTLPKKTRGTPSTSKTLWRNSASGRKMD
ncbi:MULTISPECIES: phosphoglycerate kinase [Gammaproteobacteria]|uniref:phosphoglycerate kinase n=1 Tax=Gammaproteobacteria TaxID=1236 RepID=UPI002483CB29|nr:MULTISPECIES: phosphoglycerate kinase [Halomonas]